MSNQTSKEPIGDRADKRRAYLRAKARVLIPAFLTGALSVLLVSLVLKLAGLGSKMSNLQFGAFALLLLLTVPCTVVIIFCEKKALAIPYVPPVREQVATLPSDEVLLRSSDQPAATPEELLRAAHARALTEAEELLRAERSKI